MFNFQPIVFFGTGDFTLPVVQMLKNYDLRLIVTTKKDGAVARFAGKAHIPLLVTDLSNPEDIKRIKDLKPTLGVLASYGAILPQEVIDIFPEGILNIHPSLLPKYKGPSPVQAAILNGDKTTGVTIIKLDHEVDHGPIAYQVTVNLNDNETTEYLLMTLFKIGGDLIEQIVIGIKHGRKVEFEEQDHSVESFTEKIYSEAGKVDLENPPTQEELSRMIRAYFPSPGVYVLTKLGSKERRLKLLPKKTIQVEGKNIMTYDDFVNGYGEDGKEILSKLNLLTKNI